MMLKTPIRQPDPGSRSPGVAQTNEVKRPPKVPSRAGHRVEKIPDDAHSARLTASGAPESDIVEVSKASQVIRGRCWDWRA
jgi:hypothetical protein